ncbi:MAG: type II toxin-antitoxin system RelE/ParE family toxin [Spirochaetaceae bacterium]|jgi:toxin ParE1/3/4|nr:type II toxin-antitoxin system RelE/ParE family toxin [Spirochaetaceae bacterium]
MKREIIWSKDAGDELSEIILYIKENSGKIIAENIYAKIMHKVNDASENAEGRRIAPLLMEVGITDIHQININPWIVYYKIENDTMKIISIIDGRRNLEEILHKKIIDGKLTYP